MERMYKKGGMLYGSINGENVYERWNVVWRYQWRECIRKVECCMGASMERMYKKGGMLYGSINGENV